MRKRLDYFRMAAAFMIVAIHTGPFELIGEKTDFLITYCLFRVAVPFFLMVSGYFVVADYWRGGKEKIDKYLSKLIVLYIAATAIYLPINLYAGKEITDVGHFLKTLFFDGTFYHLWYLPAAILGCLLVKFLYWILGVRASGLFVLILYVIGTFGDSYYGLMTQTYAGRNLYNEIFMFSEYTRNGIFYAPMFLWLGALVRKMEDSAEQAEGKIKDIRSLAAGLIVSVFLMVLEGLWTFENGWQIHNSMYLMLPPVMYFLFRLLLYVGQGKGNLSNPIAEEQKRAEKVSRFATFCRKASLWIYLLHPLCIILVRGGAKVMGLTNLLVENSLIHYLVVCVGSFCMAGVICGIGNVFQKRRLQKASDVTPELVGKAGAKNG